MADERAMVTCRDCKRRAPHRARGLDDACYTRHRINGTLHQYPPVRRATGDEYPIVPGVTYRQLDFWARAGYLHPVNESPGSGVPRQWPDAELRVAQTMGRLRAVGFSLEASHAVARGHTELAPGVQVLLTTVEETADA